MDGAPWIAERAGRYNHVHVYPLNDLHEHHMSQSCPCHIDLHMEMVRNECGHLGLSPYYVHNAWDGRE
ncbi:hypothetical protein SEA_GENAMY16_1 [Gordonia phage Genamy16]|uniref:Uncharacterized protein n=1 Tax=Gordonia phage Genamy16 TaxID=2926104 RepID=A0A9E7Q6D8_9CAUD|nr:hypothetical protein SEA_GENAMY16_1 [Gordonia phage Genamy16]UVK63087.1 hypothetical protein SEA_RUMI_1 [Gordonia phage Rumi]WNM65308.1 hypothetical protein SEA_ALYSSAMIRACLE_1 [Gordonia phage Alyssamiracle]